MRGKLQTRLQQVVGPEFQFEHARLSGIFWYPPGGVREWHTNDHDLAGNTKKKQESKSEEENIFASQVWRMYYIRTVRDEDFDAKLRNLNTRPADAHGHSAMHIVPGKDAGITSQV